VQKDFFDKHILDLSLERKLIKQGYCFIAGLDEVGRGALAGPVAAAAVCLSKDFIGKDVPSSLRQLKDSKHLSPRNREKIVEIVNQTKGIWYGIGVVSAETIDKINILEATKKAMLLAISRAQPEIDYLVVDGNFKLASNKDQMSVVGGDEKVFSVALASIVAKVFRDNLMIHFSDDFPQYSFHLHKGYGTLLHRQAISKYGFSALHRKSFQIKTLGKKDNI
jgi:ribonuclease HII